MHKGKTHTAIALGILACDQNKRVLFFSTASLVNELRSAHRDGTIQEMPAKIGRADLIILDEWGCLPTDPDGARPHFRVVSMCYERIPVILTTSIGFSGWGEIFNDDDMSEAMMGRIVHHGRLITCNRESYRVKHALMRGEG
ncbi:DNA replication protein DnaC [Olsenella profusa DSM 13989]|uniref:ATP-binding protein n=1 Tax=Olsenella profusa TaxID=138595 RepID=UPI002784365A|nr:ATP-binding protein [Olsenella profusa]MDP9858324.1 DNA replication protein DnaC [Olsenella profusa DSM 13989]